MLWYTPDCRSITHSRRATGAVYVCAHGLVFTKAMNTGCGINSDDRLNALEISGGRKREEKKSDASDHGARSAPDPRTSNTRTLSRLLTVSRSLKTTHSLELRIGVFDIDEAIVPAKIHIVRNKCRDDFGDRFVLFPTCCYTIISSLHFARVSDIRQPHTRWCALFYHRTRSHRHFCRRSFARIIVSRLTASTPRLTYAIRNLPLVDETARGKF